MNMKNIMLLLGVLLFTVSSSIAVQLYTYKCPACGLIQQYTIPGVYKCPNDKWTMVPSIR
jgi:hypothetical protein